MLNLASIYLGYPGGERRCQDHVTDANIVEAGKCLTQIRTDEDLMTSLDPRTVGHLIRTEGDLFFRQELYPQAIDKLNEAKRVAQENGFHIDVKYCDDRLRIVQTKANTVHHSVPRGKVITVGSVATSSEADVSGGLGSSEDELLKAIGTEVPVMMQKLVKPYLNCATLALRAGKIKKRGEKR